MAKKGAKKRSVSTCAKQRSSKFRAGNRKCSRCKVVWKKPRGALTLCPRCRAHCSRCDVELTEENHSAFNKMKTQFMCKKCVNWYSKQAYNKDGRAIQIRDNRLGRMYGITLVEYEAILKEQQGACWICGEKQKNRALAVDHKHVKQDKKQNPRETRARVRGLLCWMCNRALAAYKDDPEVLERAAAYLRAMPAQKILNKEEIDD